MFQTTNQDGLRKGRSKVLKYTDGGVFLMAIVQAFEFGVFMH